MGDYIQYDVDKIVFSHSANPDPLEPGTKEVLRTNIQYLEVQRHRSGENLNKL